MTVLKNTELFLQTNKFQKLSLSNTKKVIKAFGSSKKGVSKILKGCVKYVSWFEIPHVTNTVVI